MEEDRERMWARPDEVLPLIETPEIRALLAQALPEIAAFEIETKASN
jgi:hypothetical protein